MTFTRTYSLPANYSDSIGNVGRSLLFFIIWPFGAFIHSLYYYNRRESKAVIILFTALFGYSLIPVSHGLDLYRVMNSLPEFSGFNMREFVYLVFSVYGDSEGQFADFYKVIVTFLVSRFTENGSWLMMVFAFVAGFMYTKALSLFVDEYSERNVYTYLFIFCFSFIIGLDSISGVRFGLAAYVFFFGSIKLIISNDKKYLIIATLSILIHFSFLPICVFLVVFLKLRHYPIIIYVLLVLSFVIPNMISGYFMSYAGFLGQSIEARTELYADVGLGNEAVWYVQDRLVFLLIYCYMVLILTRIRKKQIFYSEKSNDLFLFSLLVLSFMNFAQSIPHLGYRFQFIFALFVFFYMFKLYADNSKSVYISRLVVFSFPFSGLVLAYGLRHIFYITPYSLYSFNLVSILLYEPSNSMWLQFFN